MAYALWHRHHTRQRKRAIQRDPYGQWHSVGASEQIIAEAGESLRMPGGYPKYTTGTSSD
ncbi:hypothetical protein RKLH11_304 [Rhodobacteraceae bacterium KLH11]|nr:hypothetical protein RKLH11_304 [Rhodobacteraceae bacterium KLH11]